MMGAWALVPIAGIRRIFTNTSTATPTWFPSPMAGIAFAPARRYAVTLKTVISMSVAPPTIFLRHALYTRHTELNHLGTTFLKGPGARFIDNITTGAGQIQAASQPCPG